MACYSPETFHLSEEQKEGMRQREEQRAIEYMNNTGLLLLELLDLQGEEVEDWICDVQYLKIFDRFIADKCTDKLCGILRGASEELKKKIRESKYAPYISAWWAEHKKLDQKRENEEQNKEKENN